MTTKVENRDPECSRALISTSVGVSLDIIWTYYTSLSLININCSPFSSISGDVFALTFIVTTGRLALSVTAVTTLTCKDTMLLINERESTQSISYY